MSVWPMVKLGEMAELINGDRGKNYPSEGDFFDEGIPFINAGHLTDGEVNFSKMNYINEHRFRLLGSGKTKQNDILYCLRGSLGKTAIVRQNSDAAIASSLVIIRPSNDCSVGYLYHFLTSPSGRVEVRKFDNGSSQPNLSANSVKNYLLPLPPLAEQRRIAEVLDRAEALRAKRRAALAQLDSLTQSLFLDLFGDPKSNPKAWPQKAMAELFATSPIFGSMIPPVPEKCGWLSLRVGNIQDWTLDLSDSKYVDLPAASIERHSVKDGDLLLARAIASQAHLGKCVIAHPNGEQWAFDSHLMRLRFDLKRTEPEFIRHLLMTSGGRSLFLKASRKSTVQFNINTKEISALQIPVPPIELQREFARRVTAVEKLKTAHRASLAELDALFASLQHRAFRGEL